MNLSDQLSWDEAAIVRRAMPSVTLACGIAPGLAPLQYLRESFKIHLRGLVHRGPTRRWLALLNSHPAFSEFIDHRPSVLNKIYRPYLTATLGVAQRLEVLRAHYAFLFGQGLAPMLTQASRASVQLARIAGKSGAQYDINLRAVGAFEREGELVLQLACAGVTVYSTAFTFATLDGVAQVMVGSVQGARGADAMAAIKQASRELHGLRAKALLVTLVGQIGLALGCTEVRLVGNANRTAGRAIGRGYVLADYEQFWRELGAQRRADGDFAMPCRPLAPLDLEQVEQKRRSEARKRHQLLQAVTDDVVAQFTGRGRPGQQLLAA